MKQLNKEKWLDETLSSLDGNQRAEAPEGLLEKALSKAAFGPARLRRMSTPQMWSAAACVAVLVVANLFMCLQYSRSDHKTEASSTVFAREYFGNSDATPF